MSGAGQVGAAQNVKSPLVSGQKKVKMQKPTINLSINNNVQNVIVTPAPGQYSGRQPPNHPSNPPNAHYGGSQGQLQPNAGSGMIGNLNGGQVNAPGSSNNHQMIINQPPKQKRTSSEDNVNV